MTTYGFDTLLKSNDKNYAERWSPHAVETYSNALKIDMSIDNSKALLKNLTYNLQYLEFLEFEFQELKLHSVINATLTKTYVLTSMSIIEGLFNNIIKSKGYQKKSNLENIGTIKTSKKKFEDREYIIETNILKEVPEYDVQMKLDDYIKILESHHKVLGVDHLVYPALKRLRQLRNRIHLQKVESSTDHDYNAFNDKTKKDMQEILYTIITSSTITDKPEVFDFLKP